MLLTMKSKTDHKLQLVIEGRRIKADKVIDHVMNNQTLRQSRLVGTTELSELAIFDATIEESAQGEQVLYVKMG